MYLAHRHRYLAWTHKQENRLSDIHLLAACCLFSCISTNFPFGAVDCSIANSPLDYSKCTVWRIMHTDKTAYGSIGGLAKRKFDQEFEVFEATH